MCTWATLDCNNKEKWELDEDLWVEISYMVKGNELLSVTDLFSIFLSFILQKLRNLFFDWYTKLNKIVTIKKIIIKNFEEKIYIYLQIYYNEKYNAIFLILCVFFLLRK